MNPSKKQRAFQLQHPRTLLSCSFTSVDLNKFLVLSLRVVAVLIAWGVGDLGGKEKEKASS